MVKLDQIRHQIPLSEGVSASLDDSTLSLTGPNGDISRAFSHPKVNVSIDDSNVIVQCELPRRKDKALCGTWRAHINNMVTGVTDGFEYRLKVVYSHFPMTLNVTGPTMEIKNLFGEKVPRVAKLIYHGDVIVKVEGKSDQKASLMQKFQDAISLKLENVIKWFSERFMLKTLLITPFIIINYILMCVEYNSTIFPINSNILTDSLWAVFSAIIVALFFSILLLFSGKKFKSTILLSSMIFLTIGIVHYFV